MTKPVPPTPPPRREGAFASHASCRPRHPGRPLPASLAASAVDRSREEIIDAVRRVLFRDGLAATTLLAVAREVGLTKAALYYYYPSKDAMLF
ncbi:MAG: helix-turn-helix transcriptional regulator, partial [Sandaracinaceae bacterium]|nr:helix-turn-helix transcriptional regulator [Sandaracinaceae bacterium]